MNYLPAKLQKLRKHYNYSQSYLADVLGVDVSDYMGFENGRKMINYEQMSKLASFYHVNIIEIFRNNEDVTLHKNDKNDTDTINIEYFIPKKTILYRIKRHPLLSGALFGLIVAIVVVSSLVLNNNKARPYVSNADNQDRLSVSDTSLIYIDNLGAVKGAGDNANGQISNLPSDKATKVAEGKDFSLILLNDGTLVSSGLSQELQKEISSWTNIVDIAAGLNHIVAVDNKGNIYGAGDNSKNQLDIYDFDDIKNVFATSLGTIVVDYKGEIDFAGSFIGTSLLNKNSNIIDVCSSDENLIILKEDGTCDYAASHDDPKYFEVTKWTDIVDVVCGNTYFAGLKKSGEVEIVSSSFNINEVKSWTNIIAIDGTNDYLIGFDGENINGEGKCDYHQFEVKEVVKEVLDSVTNINVNYNASEVSITFNEVSNAKGYEVSLYLDDKNKQTLTVKTNDVVKFSTSDLIDNNVYLVSITAVGDELHENSKPSTVDFIYLKEVEDSDTKVTIVSTVKGFNRYDFEEYLKSLGVEEIGSYVDEDKPCSEDEETVLDVIGIEPGKTYTSSELKARNIAYTYCKLNLGDHDE